MFGKCPESVDMCSESVMDEHTKMFNPMLLKLNTKKCSACNFGTHYEQFLNTSLCYSKQFDMQSQTISNFKQNEPKTINYHLTFI